MLCDVLASGLERFGLSGMTLTFLFGSSRSPVQVLVISLVFIAFVVVLHILGKVRSSALKEDE